MKELKTFCGMISYYRRFILNCSRIAFPLHKLLKTGVNFEWKVEQEHVFQHLKAKLTSQPILQYLDYSKEFVLTMDTSNIGLGAVLSQGLLGKDLPVAYASRSLNKAKINYSTSEKELLAIVWVARYFRPYLYRRHFKIVTDHKPSTWIMNVKDPCLRLLRWKIQLEEFDYEITYKRGSQNMNISASSRIGGVTVKAEGSTKLDEETKKQILYEFHDVPVEGHQDMNKTFRAIKSWHTWPNMRRDIEEYVKQYKSCQVNKTLKPKRKALVGITSTVNHPFDIWFLNIVGLLPPSATGDGYILTFQDDLSKYVVATLISQQDSETVARVFVSQVALKYGTPSIV